MKQRLLEDIAATSSDNLHEGLVELDFAKELPKEIIDEIPPVNWTMVLEMADRREAAAKDPKPCPYCDSIQVQLTQWATPTLQFKCRTCKQKFVRTLK